MSWALGVAIYGAGLSTVLALSRLNAKRPVICLARAQKPGDDPPSARLQIVNHAKRPLFIDGSRQIRVRGPRKKFGIVEQQPLYQQETIARAYAERRGDRSRYPRLYVPAEGEAFLSVSGIEDGSARLVIIWWHRNWLFHRLRLPEPVWVTSDLVSQANRR